MISREEVERIEARIKVLEALAHGDPVADNDALREAADLGYVEFYPALTERGRAFLGAVSG